MDGMSSVVRRKCPTKLPPKTVSRPSAVRALPTTLMPIPAEKKKNGTRGKEGVPSTT